MDWPSASPAQLREGLSLGGGRGVFASQALKAGQLVLIESPLVTVPDDKAADESLHVSLARAVLLSPHRAALMQLVAPLHPIALGDLPVEGLARARQHYAPDVQQLLQLLQQHQQHSPQQPQAEGDQQGQARDQAAPPPSVDADGGVTEDDVLRLILAVQCNAFYSGFYLYCSMFNHRCKPNCIKLARPDGTSEVRAVRDIAEGEECSISYLAPPLQSFGRRLRHLHEQHYFTLQQPSEYAPEGEELASASEGQDLPDSYRQVLCSKVQPHEGAGAPGEGVGGRQGGEEGAGATGTGSGSGRPTVGEGAGSGEAAEGLTHGPGAGVSPAEGQGAHPSRLWLIEQLEDRLDELEGWMVSVSRGPVPAETSAPKPASAAASGAQDSAGTGQQLQGVGRVDGARGDAPGAGAAGRPAKAKAKGAGAAQREAKQAWQLREATRLWEASEKLREAAAQVAGSCHVALVRLDSLLLSAARLRLDCVQDPCGPEAAEAALQLLGVAGRLREGQEKLLGPDHYDVTATLESIHQTLNFMLSNAPKQLFAALPVWGTFSKASLAESQAKKRCRQLQMAYSSG